MTSGDPGLADALTRIRAVTPYFELHHGPGEERVGLPTRRLRDPDVAGPLFDGLAAALGTSERRVAVSMLFLDYAAHLWSVALGTALLTGRSADLDPDTLRFRRDGTTTTLHTGLARPGGTPAGEVLDRQLEPLVAAWSADVSAGLLWGNAASCVVSTGALLGPASAGLVSETLSDPRLADALDPVTRRRRSCCLYYRSSTGGYCGDCALIPPADG